MPGLVMAAVTSDNVPGGGLFSLWFPLGLFIIVAAITWRVSFRPHRRVPPRRIVYAAAQPAEQAGQPGQPGTGAQGAGE